MLSVLKWAGSILAALIIVLVFGTVMVAATGILWLISVVVGVGFLVVVVASYIKENWVS